MASGLSSTPPQLSLSRARSLSRSLSLSLSLSLQALLVLAILFMYQNYIEKCTYSSPQEIQCKSTLNN